MKNKFCLGTVQFGLKYGINNQINRQPNENECFDILQEAIKNKIEYFDTASVYGNAEEVLGAYRALEKQGKIITKLSPINEVIDNNIVEYILRECRHSLYRLNCNKLDGYLLHRAKDMYKKDVIKGLQECKNQNLVKNIGISIYEPEDALYAVNNLDIDYIQIPYNILDQRLNHNNFFLITKKKNIKVFARSSYLQGLLLMDLNEIKIKMPLAFEYIKIFDDICKDYNYSRKEAAFLFCYMNSGIDYLVFGVDTKKQLIENMNMIKKKEYFSQCYRRLVDLFDFVEKKVITPYLW